MAKDFPGVRALDGVDLDIAAGEVHALVGENGAGKSTLMNVVGGIITDYDGEMSLDGRPLRLRGPRDADRLGIRVIHQELTLVPPMTVAENICLGQEECGLAGLGVSRSCVRQRAAAILDDLGFDLPLEAPVEALGTGQQQLVEVAHAFAREMRVLILDEPTAALVPADVDRLFRVLKDLRARGLAIVYISHRLAELPRIADRVTVLRDGRVVGTYQTGDVSMAEVARLMMGRDLREAFPERRAPGHDVLMSVRGLSLPGRLHDISFDLRAGEILGLAGLVGAGRTELLRCLFGAEAVAAKVEVAGGQAVVRSPRDARRLGLALVPEDRRGQGLVLGRPVAENLALTTMTRLAPRGFLGRRRLMDYARDLIARFKVSPPDPSAEVGNLSGGNQQKVAIAKWVATAPRVYLFDEPTRGLDVGARAEVYRLIADLAAEGHGVIVVSSEVPEVIGLAHRVLVLCGGRIAAEMNAAGATEDAVLAVCAGDASAA
jgi:ribose transport system ATP-binding protein